MWRSVSGCPNHSNLVIGKWVSDSGQNSGMTIPILVWHEFEGFPFIHIATRHLLWQRQRNNCNYRKCSGGCMAVSCKRRRRWGANCRNTRIWEDIKEGGWWEGIYNLIISLTSIVFRGSSSSIGNRKWSVPGMIMSYGPEIVVLSDDDHPPGSKQTEPQTNDDGVITCNKRE